MKNMPMAIHLLWASADDVQSSALQHRCQHGPIDDVVGRLKSGLPVVPHVDQEIQALAAHVSHQDDDPHCCHACTRVE